MFKVPEDGKEIMKKINDSGYECYLVGGVVRDAYLDISNKDFDLCTNMPLCKIKEIIPEFVIMKENNHRNTGVIRKKDYDYEISFWKGKTIEEDLQNRDFTINAMALKENGILIDPYHGIEDIKNKTISLVIQNGNAFIVDPLRIMRAIRLSGQLHFQIDQNCLFQMEQKKELLSSIAPERVYEEFKKIMLLDNCSELLEKHKNILFQIIPELKMCDGFHQNNEYHDKDVLKHTLCVLNHTKKNIFLRLAALFHDIGKPKTYTVDENGIGHFLGHAEESNQIFLKFASLYKLDNKTKNIVSKLILYHENELSFKNNKIYNFLKKYGMEVSLLFELKKADIKGQNPKYMDRIKVLEEQEKKYQEIIYLVTHIVYNGKDIYNLGYRGKSIGIILEDITRMIVNGQLENNSFQIEEYIKNKKNLS